jgi:hypothetical protein
MKRRIVALLACAVLPATLRAAPFEEARVTETINLVSLLLQLREPQPATVGDVIKGETALKTGGESRAELKFPDLTITRVGSNSLFRFYAGGRDMTLDGGTMLFYSPRGAGGGKVQAGAVTAAVTGSAVSILNLTPIMKTPYIRVVCLEHAAVVSGPSFTRRIRAGQVIDQDGKVSNIDLAAFARSSNLYSGFSTPLPFVLRDYQKARIDLDTKVDSTARLAQRTILGDQQGPVATDQPGQPPAPGSQPAVLSPSGPQPPPGPPGPPKHHKHHKLFKLLNKLAHRSPPDTPPPDRPPPDTPPPNGGGGEGGGNGGVSGGNGGEKGNNGNRRDIQNRGNSGVRLNRGNR